MNTHTRGLSDRKIVLVRLTDGTDMTIEDHFDEASFCREEISGMRGVVMSYKDDSLVFIAESQIKLIATDPKEVTNG